MRLALTSYAASGGSGEELTGVAGWAADVMEALGPVGAGVLIFLENLFPPLPSELILPLAGFTAGQGRFGLAPVLVWTTAGSVLGALLLYGIGAALGRDRVHALWDRLPLVDERDLERTEAWFERHGRKAVFLGRMLPIFRSLISVPAGVERMPLLVFLVLTTAGSAIWNTVFVLAGYWLGDRYTQAESVAGYVQYAVVAAVALGVAWFAVRRIRSIRAARHTGPTER
ncbi:DedA family protein [Nocardioides perillae]|uniref:Membrane protein DedA with SNARE-associated domain n=1 Tax=Nocardioides perillae TaxID=1119534 RepID=A0A7Y9URL0_9ACTN|nr:DedA family protein [Nocardioides perillae]NYG54539.1 membrane protein DedA with SNARE-associated domain [Nocardioides perillae]